MIVDDGISYPIARILIDPQELIRREWLLRTTDCPAIQESLKKIHQMW